VVAGPIRPLIVTGAVTGCAFCGVLLGSRSSVSADLAATVSAGIGVALAAAVEDAATVAGLAGATLGSRNRSSEPFIRPTAKTSPRGDVAIAATTSGWFSKTWVCV